jgi:small subunit ribosomal protein S2
VDYVIPSNDDAIRAIKLLVSKMAEAVLEGKAMRKDEDGGAEEVKPAADTVVEMKSKAARPVETDEEVADEKLLGKSTLAKLGPAPKVDEVVVVEDTGEGK